MYANILKTSEASRKAWESRKRKATEAATAESEAQRARYEASSKYVINEYRYAKGKVAVQTPSPDNYKTRAGRLAEAVGGKWAHRAKGYLMSLTQAEKFKKYVAEGYDANSITLDIIPPVKKEKATYSDILKGCGPDSKKKPRKGKAPEAEDDDAEDMEHSAKGEAPRLRPKPGTDTRSTWMSRCMRNERYKGKFSAPDQQLAVCLSMQERAGLPKRIEKMEFAKVLKDSAASAKAWQSRERGKGSAAAPSPHAGVVAHVNDQLASIGKDVTTDYDRKNDTKVYEVSEENMGKVNQMREALKRVGYTYEDLDMGAPGDWMISKPDGGSLYAEDNGNGYKVQASLQDGTKKVQKDSAASNKAWVTRGKSHSAVSQGSDGYTVEVSETQVNETSGKERVVSVGTTGPKGLTKEAAQASAFNLNNPKANATTGEGQLPRTPMQEKRHQKELESDNWHTRTMAQMKDKSSDSLRFIREDASKAAKAMQSVGNYQKEGKYLDEAHYASMELSARDKASKAKKADHLGLAMRF